VSSDGYNILKEHQLLQKKAKRLMQEKAKWELKYKWLTWQLEGEKGSVLVNNEMIRYPFPGELKAVNNDKM